MQTELVQVIHLEPPLPIEVPHVLKSIKKTKDLRTSTVYKTYEKHIEAITSQLIFEPRRDTAHVHTQRSIRIASWNIQRGIQIDGIKKFIAHNELLKSADVFLLNEVDIGMARSGNRNIAQELAHFLGFSFVFGNSYLCLDNGNSRDGNSREKNTHGLHGNAIVSRFPIRRAENFSLPILFDKFEHREKRLGHKRALLAEIDTPCGILPIVAVHLDCDSSPKDRSRQMRSVVQKIEERSLDNRVLIGGDFNTSTYDLKNLCRLLTNITVKFLRGGFSHALHHYLYPDRLYEKPLFDVLERYGYNYREMNKAAGTVYYEVGSFDSESRVKDFLPSCAVKFLRWKLKPWNGVVPLKMDWFASKGLTSKQVSLVESIKKPSWNGIRLSDHDPIFIDLQL